jgi:putative membrane protein
MHVRNLAIGSGVVGILALATATAWAHGVNMSAENFVRKASIANEFEIESSKLALEKSENNDIKSFAQKMVDDHTKTGNKLKDVLQSSQSPLVPVDKLDDAHQEQLDKLEASAGKSFDRRYIALQTDAHKDAVQLFDGYSLHGKDKALKDFAAETLPALQNHLKHVKELRNRK